MDLGNLTRQLKQQAFTLGLLPGTTEYTRFIILGRSRVGTNLLRGLLDAHSQVVAYGELFQNFEQINWGGSVPQQGAGILRHFQEQPVRFLEQEIFKRYSIETCAVGFKLFYYHAQNDAWKSIWAHLRGQSDLRVLHTKRANILKTHLSWKLANETGRWVKLDAEIRQEPSISLSYQECVEAFTKTREWENQFDAYFAGQPLLEVVYEDLARDFAGEMKRVWSFLDVPFEAVRPSTHKQAHRPLATTIANYLELKEQFSGTEWEPFFEE